jgi:hypothetical protein
MAEPITDEKALRGHSLFTFTVLLPDGTEGFLQVRAASEGTSQEAYNATLATAYRLVDGCACLKPHSTTFVFAPDKESNGD